MGGPAKQDKAIPGKQSIVGAPAGNSDKAGGQTRLAGTSNNPIAAYSQSVRVGRAASARLDKLMPELTATAVSDLTILDARRALRELDEAIEQTKVLPMLADPVLEDDHKDLVRLRGRLPAVIVNQIQPMLTKPAVAPPPPVAHKPPPPPAMSKPPRLAFQPETLVFKSLVGDVDWQTVRITNLDDEDVALDDVNLPNQNFMFEPLTDWVLAAGATTELRIAYAPGRSGSHGGFVHVGSRGAPQAAFAVDARARAPRLVARPDKVEFDDKDQAVIAIYTEGQRSTGLESASVAGGGGAFTTQFAREAVVMPETVPLSGVVVVGYDYAHQGAVRTGTLRVATLDGATLELPVATPAALPPPQGFDVFPSSIELVGAMHEPASTTGTAKRTAVAATPATVTLRNRGLKTIYLEDVRFTTNAGQGFYLTDLPAWKEKGRLGELAPGGQAELRVGFTPHDVGSYATKVEIVGARGQVLASLDATAVAELRQDAPSPTKIAGTPAPEPKHEAERKVLHEARLRADHALDAWNLASEKAIRRSEGTLHDDWSRYLTFASANPEIPKSLLPGSTAVKDFLQNAFGNSFSEGPLKPVIDKVVKSGSSKLAKRVVGAAAASLMASGAGFVLGVFIETMAGLLFNYLTDDDDAELRAAYQEGYKDGSINTGTAIRRKGKEVHQAATVALGHRDAHFAQLKALIEAGGSVAELDKATADLAEVTKALAGVQPLANALSTPLLELWVRKESASTDGGNDRVSDPLWKAAVKELAKSDPDHHDAEGKLQNIPDLFVAQAMSEWNQRGLPANEALASSFRTELGYKASDVDVRTRAWADVLAGKFAQRFSGREIVWDRPGQTQLSETLAKEVPGVFGENNDDFDVVVSTPFLTVDDGCCVVTEFIYRVVNTRTGANAVLRSAPSKGITFRGSHSSPGADFKRSGKGGVDHEDHMWTVPAPLQRERMYALMGQLTSAGTTLVPETSGKTRLGGEAFRISEQHSSGRPASLAVYRVAGELKTPDGFSYLDYALMEVRSMYGEAMIRGGDVILLLTPDQLDDLGAVANT